jgi:hypothetical protein
MKNCNKEKSGKNDFLDNCPAEKSVHFFGKGCLQKLYRKGAMKGKKSKKSYLQN